MRSAPSRAACQAGTSRHTPELEDATQLDDLIAGFEDPYGRVYARSARSPELGYLVTHAIVTGTVAVEKPALPELEEREGTPDGEGSRPVYWSDRFEDTPIYELDDVEPGNAIAGPAVVGPTRGARRTASTRWRGRTRRDVPIPSEPSASDVWRACRKPRRAEVRSGGER